jgi:hypothetical protein
MSPESRQSGNNEATNVARHSGPECLHPCTDMYSIARDLRGSNSSAAARDPTHIDVATLAAQIAARSNKNRFNF